MGNDVKISQFTTRKELADFLHKLAQALKTGGEEELACVDDFKKIKISAKDEFGQICLKVRIKSEVPCEDFTDETGQTTGKPKYKTLKKRMKSSFKLLLKMIHENQMPPRAAIDSFLEDSELMVTYPGYGDDYYDDYIRACSAFKAACDAEDLARMHETIDALVHEKSRCHAKYD